MKPYSALLLLALSAAQPSLADIQTDWAYHAIGSGNRMSERVPGEDFNFLANGSDQVGDAETVTLYLLAAHEFAGDMDEQIYVRWWDGTMSHWIIGSWIKDITLDASRPETCFHGLPAEGTMVLGLWKVEIPPEVTQPGENFYAIQMKGYSKDATEERYLLRVSGGDFSQSNNFGQIWSASEEFDGQDWKVNVLQ
jgi:hypothetical protein